jgi:DNA-binding MarR family transcriptional regulator
MVDESMIHGCTSSKVRQLMRRIAQHYDAEVAQAGLKTTQYSLLCRVAELGPVRAVDLAAAQKMTPSTLSRNLQPLVAAGWVAIDAGEDARCHRISLTSAGLKKRNEARQYWRVAQRKLNALMGVERVLELHALIDESLAILAAEDATTEAEG